MCAVDVCVVLFVSKQEALEMIHNKDINPGFLVVSFWVGFLFPFVAESYTNYPAFFGRYSEWHPTDVML